MCRATLLPAPESPLTTTMRPAALILPGGASGAQRPALHGVMVCHLFLVLLDASIQLVGEQIDGGVHVLLGRVRMDRVTAHVQGRLGLLSQFLHRQYAMHVDDLLEMSSDALELLLHI